QDKDACRHAATLSLKKLEQMKQLAVECAMPAADIEFMADTFSLLALAREYCFEPFSEEIEQQIRHAKRTYKAKYPKHGPRYRYRVKINFQPFWVKARYLAWV